MPRCYIQAPDRLEIAQAAFVNRTVVTKYICLAGHTVAEGVHYRFRDPVRAVANDINARISAANDLGGVAPLVILHLRLGRKDLTSFYGL